ncbi:MoaD/ThiS family protein [Helicobacter anatolicus]|uniref:MoaD/ThiS family protein n=1 Tax=Helicobacter anatolicus TaxID=2905874 RepID=UPI001E5C420C|nr:MoaD/ThiS family protein [Helicobacter anatolicus]MCE3037618.1 MoaD/ThiS family protein [Helicobacter anatolicus]MCE3039049.1 MoaD/ThiS family protein [Helicobacter anatolicus]MCE3040416.1 MoaD/ThiS family protein [Helicobacter anatolicus]
MIRVEFLGPIGLEAQEFDVKNLNELKKELQKIKELESWLELSAIAVNDELVSTLEIDLKDGDRVVLLPPVCGG